MKNVLFFTAMLGSLVMAETYTWDPQGDNTLWSNASNWQLSDGSRATSVPEYTNTSNDTYIIGNGATVNATGVSVGNLGATLQAGNNVTLISNWAFIFKNISIGSGANFNGMSGDAIKWAVDSKTSNVANELTLNSSYSANNRILSTIGVGSSVNFCTNGYISLIADDTYGSGVESLQGKALTLSASITLTPSADVNAPLEMVTRYLIGGYNIYYRDVTNENKVVDYTSSFVSETGNLTLTKYELAKSEDAAWMLNGVEVGTDDLTAGAYLFVATEAEGIGIQYWKSVPEPGTATLSLLALAGLMARRRRRVA